MKWEQNKQLGNTPETCDFVVGGGGGTTKDVTDPRRCGSSAGWERGGVLACGLHCVENLQESQTEVPSIRLAKQYVLGFCFGPLLTTVVLIRKTRPAWQEGRLNGVGGRVEEGETPAEAMAREFREEAGDDEPLAWMQFGRLSGGGWEVHLFHARFPRVPTPYNRTDEGEVSAHHVGVVLRGGTSKGAAPLPNLRYLIPMALNRLRGEDAAKFFEAEEVA